MAAKLPGQSGIPARLIAAVRRAQGLPSYMLAGRIGADNTLVGVALNRMAKDGRLLAHKMTDPTSPYWNITVYYLPDSHQ